MGLLLVLARRLGQIAVTVVAVALLVFGLMRLLPGDPALVLAGDRASDADIARLHEQMGLNHSLLVQFWDFLANAATLNLGDSLLMQVPVKLLNRDG